MVRVITYDEYQSNATIHIGKRIVEIDDYVIDEEGASWTHICKTCARKLCIPKHYISEGGSGEAICGIAGCERRATAGYFDIPHPGTLCAKNSTDWFKTDDYQLCQKLSETKFSIIEFRTFMGAQIHPNTKFPNSTVYIGTKFEFDISEMSKTDIVETIQSYGYNSIEAVSAAYPENADQIIAECLAESWPISEGKIVFKGTKQQADAWITEFISKENKS
ncbi:MAG: hypothetical protein WC725_04890 [Patescibacteria group bacterium]|jgi:hypothetical protein